MSRQLPDRFPIDPSRTRRVMDQARSAGLGDWPQVQRAALAAGLTRSPALMKGVSQAIGVAEAVRTASGKAFKVPFPGDLMEGVDPATSLFMGFVDGTNQGFHYPRKHLPQHIAVTAASGEGKSNLGYSLFIQAMRLGMVVWVFERDKTEFRHCLKLHPDFVVFDTATFPYNPYEVHWPLEPHHALNVTNTTFAKENNLLDGSHNTISVVTRDLFRERGVFDGSEDYPTVREVRDRIASPKHRAGSRSAGFQESLLNRLDMMLAEAPRMYAYRKGIPLHQLMRQNAVWELGNLSERHVRFLVLDLLYKTFLVRQALQRNPGNTDDLPVLLIIIDEAKFLAPIRPTDLQGFPILNTIISLSRQSRMGFVFASQSAQVEPAIFENSRLLLSARLGEGRDARRIQEAMGLTADQTRQLMKLDVGTMVARIPRLDPFVVRIPKVRLD